MNQLLAMRVFLRVVESESFTQAANQLFMPRSTVSKLITDLEKHLGIKLIHRTTRAVAITPEGLEYYSHALRIIGELDEVDNAIGDKKLKPGGHLRIDAPASFATCLLIPALPEFEQEYPDISLSLGVSDRTVNILGEGVDCAIRAGTLQDMSMIGRKICELRNIVCASPAYLQRRGTPTTPAEVAASHIHAGYFFASSGKPDPLVFERDGEHISIDNGKYCTNDGSGLTSMMLAGLGIGQHMQAVVQPWLDSGELVEILPEWSRPSVSFHAIYPPNRHQSARLRVFIDWLVTRFGGMT